MGAAYGRADVTSTLNASITSSQTLSVRASNSVFGDSWKNVRKTLVVVYQHSGYDPRIVIVREHFYDTLNIAARPSRYCIQSCYNTMGQNDLIIVGAAYGLADVTYQVQKMVRNNQLSVSASNSVFGDTYNRVRKTLVVVYLQGSGGYKIKIVTEGNTLRI